MKIIYSLNLKIDVFGGIDIGSNAVRLLIAHVVSANDKLVAIRKVSLVRVPIRLGSDVFHDQIISDNNKSRLIEAMKSYALLMRLHKVSLYRAAATSAMRESKNGGAIVDEIYQTSGIQVNIIDGMVEADILASMEISVAVSPLKTYLYIDVGGGSTELSVIKRGVKLASQSFRLGTLRLGKSQEGEKEWLKVKKWVSENTKNMTRVHAMGSGGSINTVFSQSRKKEGKPLTYEHLKNYYDKITDMSYEDRVVQLGLKPDRADVIEPALKIYLNAMKWGRAVDIFVPKIGLADGIVKSIHLGTLEGYPVHQP